MRECGFEKGPTKREGMDGNYLLVIALEENLPNGVSVKVKAEMKMSTGYLSAVEWPLFLFYGVMSLVYLVYGISWFILFGYRWKEFIGIQFWIGGVVALGLLEKTVLFFEYNHVNNTGVPAHSLVVLALVFSSIKSSGSRILNIIISMGFGILNRIHLGAAMLCVLGVGCLHFILSIINGIFREFLVKGSVNRNEVIIFSLPLSLLDAVILLWIFWSLRQTMRELRIHENHVMLSLYQHFTKILIVSVIVSVAFMIWVTKAHSFNNCITNWKNIWFDDGFWHLLSASILLAIIVLWRPRHRKQPMNGDLRNDHNIFKNAKSTCGRNGGSEYRRSLNETHNLKHHGKAPALSLREVVITANSDEIRTECSSNWEQSKNSFQGEMV